MKTNHFIEIGVGNNETTTFEVLTCPYCHSKINWKDFYSVVDKHETLLTDSSVVNDEYICPRCKKAMRVCLDVLVHAEKLDSVPRKPLTFAVEGDTVTIKGEGIITEAFTKNIKKALPKKIVIEEGIFGIENYAFADFDYLEAVSLPESLVQIGTFAFSRCSLLKQITIPKGVKSIAPWSFASCENLKQVILPITLESIKESAFVYCYNLEEATIPNGVTQIGKEAFRRCEALSVSVPKSVTHIGIDAFSDCKSVDYK